MSRVRITFLHITVFASVNNPVIFKHTYIHLQQLMLELQLYGCQWSNGSTAVRNRRM